MTPEALKEISQLMGKYRIFFKGPVPQESWPDDHESLFESLQKLGKMEYCDYVQARLQRMAEDPRGSTVIERTARVVEKATRLRAENHNEAGWRLGLEGEIFARFTYEITW